MILLLDNYDSFTYNLVDYFGRAGVRCAVFRNDEPMEAICSQEWAGVVLSPGPGRPETAGRLLEVVRRYAGRAPILGICLGHQALGLYYGGEVVKAFRPMHGKLSRISVQEGGGLYRGLPRSFEVCRYHSLVVEGGEGMRTLAVDEHGQTMAFRHERHLSWGVQYHPEAIMTHYGLETLHNWAAFNHLTDTPFGTLRLPQVKPPSLN